MDREGFRSRLKQYKKAREENPGLKYYDFMEKLAEFKAKEWQDNPDVVLTEMLNDNTYNYRQMYEDDPSFEIKEGHFEDTYKTVYHPTFSNESMYSGKQSEFNPRGTIGGRWADGNEYRPSYSQVFNGDFDFPKTEKYLRENNDGEYIDWYYSDIEDRAKEMENKNGAVALHTYYPITSLYPLTGHSSLSVAGLVPNYYGDAIVGKIFVNKGMHNKGYNLVTNNCSDATRCALEKAFDKKINPFLFTTPGDVRDFALDELSGKESKKEKGTSTVYIPVNKDQKNKLIQYVYKGGINREFADGGVVPKYDGGGKVIPTQEEYIAEQIAARKAAALEKSLSRTMPRVPQGIKIGEQWNPVTKKVEDIHECGPSCAYTFSDNYGLNWMGSEDFKQNHANYGWRLIPWESRQPGDAVLIVDDKGTARHTMMYNSDNAQGQPLFNHSNGGHDESAIRKKAKYPHHNPYLTYEFVGTPADSTQWISDYKKIYGYAEGTDGVTGPPTYEQWDADMNQYNPTILDNASMYWSIEAAKKALHNEAMKLPGYAERWTEYYRSLPKNDPDINEFVDELWANENPNNVGLKNGKYYPHKSPEGGKPTIGPGFKIGSGSHRITKKQAERGMTKARLNQEARYIGKQHLNAVDQFINYGQTTNPADTVSPQIKMGLMDLRHQVGPLNEWGNLRQAVLNGDLEGIRKESTVTWNDNGKTKVDKRRKKIRDEKYFYYE